MFLIDATISRAEPARCATEFRRIETPCPGKMRRNSEKPKTPKLRFRRIRNSAPAVASSWLYLTLCARAASRGRSPGEDDPEGRSRKHGRCVSRAAHPFETRPSRLLLAHARPAACCLHRNACMRDQPRPLSPKRAGASEFPAHDSRGLRSRDSWGLRSRVFQGSNAHTSAPSSKDLIFQYPAATTSERLFRLPLKLRDP
jgi:hypothetical protein